MGRIYKNAYELIGHTPLLELERYNKAHGLSARILAKLEYLNPAGSVKDRAAFAMITAAEEQGILKPGSVIIEPTSGNTGIGLAAYGVPRGYRVILTMPETMSEERRSLLKAYGAEVVLTDGGIGMKGAIEKAYSIAREYPGSFIPSQFENPVNARAHKETTGPEIWEDTDGEVALFVAGVGTGGTLTGTGEYLKEKNAAVRLAAVEPAGSPVLSEGWSGAHGLQGIGAGFVPGVLDRDLIDEIVTVTEEEAYLAGRELAKLEGILAGISSGAALAAAAKLGRRSEYAGALIVVLLPDTGDRYLSTPLFNGSQDRL